MAQKQKADNLDKLNFEQALDQLRQIVEKVEAGEIGLEDSIEQYEKGCKLIRHCRKILTDAEQRIDVLTKDLQEKLHAEPAEDLTDEIQNDE